MRRVQYSPGGDRLQERRNGRQRFRGRKDGQKGQKHHHQEATLDPNLPLMGMATGEEHLARAMARTSYTMMLLAIAAAVALFLGSIGIYGVISYAVGQRTREIGVRMALGAARSDVSRMVVRQGLSLTLLGVGLGVAAALASTRSMAALLYGVPPTDPLTFASIGVFLSAVATLASYLPARRASGIAPMRALHYE